MFKTRPVSTTLVINTSSPGEEALADDVGEVSGVGLAGGVEREGVGLARGEVCVEQPGEAFDLLFLRELLGNMHALGHGLPVRAGEGVGVRGGQAREVLGEVVPDDVAGVGDHAYATWSWSIRFLP